MTIVIVDGAGYMSAEVRDSIFPNRRRFIVVQDAGRRVDQFELQKRLSSIDIGDTYYVIGNLCLASEALKNGNVHIMVIYVRHHKHDELLAKNDKPVNLHEGLLVRFRFRCYGQKSQRDRGDRSNVRRSLLA